MALKLSWALRGGIKYDENCLICNGIAVKSASLYSQDDDDVTVEFVTSVTSVTVEEGRAAILNCPGFVPNPEGDRYAMFMWYKASQSNRSIQNRVAFYDKTDGVQNSLGDLSGRATIDGTTGALEIPQTRLSDDHVYTCNFHSTASGDIQSETGLVITGKPSGQPQIIGNMVMADSTITFICDTERVNGTITWYKWQFANGTDLGNTTERTWAYKVKEGDNILMFECIVGNTVGQSAPSAPIAVQTRGQSGCSSVIIITCTLLACSLVGYLAMAVCLFCRWKHNNAPSQTNQTQRPREKQTAQWKVKDDGNQHNTVESAPYDEVRILPPVMHYLKGEDDGYVGPSPRNYVNISEKDAKLYENNPAAMPPPVYEEPDLKEMPTYLELH